MRGESGEPPLGLANLDRSLGEPPILAIGSRHDHSLLRTGRLREALTEVESALAVHERLGATSGAHYAVGAVLRYTAAVRLGLTELAVRAAPAAAHPTRAAPTMTPDDWLTLAKATWNGSNLEGDFALERTGGTREPWEVDDVRALIALDRGDYQAVRAAGSRAVAAAPRGTLTSSHWLLVVAEAELGHRVEAERRLAAIGSNASTGNDWYTVLDAGARAALGRWPEVRAALEPMRARGILRDRQVHAMLDGYLGLAYLETGDAALAIPPLEEGADILSLNLGGHAIRATFELALARALWETGGDQARALSLAERARDHLAQLGPLREPDRQRAELWLADHSP